MTKRTTKNGKDKNRVKGWNGIAPFKERSYIKKPPAKPPKEPHEMHPLDESLRKHRDKIAADPYARRAVTEVVKGMTGVKR